MERKVLDLTPGRPIWFRYHYRLATDVTIRVHFAALLSWLSVAWMGLELLAPQGLV